MKAYLTTTLILLTHLALHAQTIRGKLIDTATQQPLPFVSLSLTKANSADIYKYTSSDSLGFFKFNDVEKNTYLLSVSLLGYTKFQQQITLTVEQPSIDFGILQLKADANLLNTVTVSGGTPSFSTTNGQMKIGIANNTFFKSSANLIDVFRKLPGIQISPDGAMLLGSRTAPTLFVDGKPLQMNADEIQIYLSSLTPDMVETVEIINQPPAKYDGQYQGIIDVRLKRNQSLGMRGAYNSRMQQNKNFILDHNLSLIYKTQKFAYTFNAGQILGSTNYKYHALQFLSNNNALTTDTRTVTQNENYNLQARVVFEPKSGHQIEVFLRTYQIDREATSDNQLITQNQSRSQNLSAQQSDNNANPKQHNYAGGINYDAKFKSGELHIITALAQIDNRQQEDIRNSNRLTNALMSHWKTNSRNNILIRSVQGDYTQPIKGGKLEFGGKYAYTSTANNLRYDTLFNGAFYLDPNRTNNFTYREYIAAAYLSFLGTKGKFNYSLSLRAENTKTLATTSANNVTERNYLKWLPSASLTFEIKNGQQLSINYSKRITRPTFDALNPFRFYYSPRHYWIGNPYLQPSTTSLVSLSYSNKSLNIALNAGREKDPMARYPEYDQETNILIFKGDNLPYRDFANLQANMPITINKWWRTNNNIAFYYNRELRPYFGQNFKIPVFNYTFNGSQVFTLKNLVVDFSYSYESRSGNSLYIFEPVYTFDIALQRSWFANKINTRLAWQDMFDNGQRRLIFREKSIIDNDFYHDNGINKLVFSLSYSFGSSTYKTKESRRSEEETRANRQ